MVDKVNHPKLPTQTARVEKSQRQDTSRVQKSVSRGLQAKSVSKEQISQILAKNFGEEILQDDEFGKMRDWIYKKLSKGQLN